ncbi:MAG: rhodanese-like domain-containing protein [Myxococcota bacterium]|nr:rhodanese-like domain-containing protein [Myxococcota bacterium]
MPRNDAEVKPSELAELIRQRRAVPVDVRDAASYRRHRIPTALHIPAADVETRISELRSLDGRIRVLYGRSTDEARELAERLASRGVRVGYLAGGLLHWEADGLPVERPA